MERREASILSLSYGPPGLAAAGGRGRHAGVATRSPANGFHATRAVYRFLVRCQYPAISRLMGWASAAASTAFACSRKSVRRLS